MSCGSRSLVRPLKRIFDAYQIDICRDDLAGGDEREDFLWVSGIWRDLPPGRQWMPGYWAEVESGYQWISGYWADAAQTEIQYQHYYFGDYYANNYSTGGYYPLFSYGSSGHGYDPFYARQRWDNRQDQNWHARIERDFANRRDHEDQRPPRTLRALLERKQNAPQSDDKSLLVAMSLDQLTSNQENPQRFQTIDKNEREALVQRRQEMQKFRNERQKLEADTTATRLINPTEPNEVSEPVKVKLPKSPVVSATVETPGKGVSAPKSPDIPKVDPTVRAKPRVPRQSRPNPENAKGSVKRPGGDAKPPALKKTPGAKPRSGKQGDPESKGGKSDPMPDVPKVDPKPDVPKVNPKPGTPGAPKSDVPKGEPKPKRGKADTKTDVPKEATKPAVPNPQPKPDVPKAEPEPQLPKGEPTKPPKP